MKQPKDINVLIACEESQAECLAFLRRGFNAFSCDIQPCRPSGIPARHIHGDVTPYLHGETVFRLQTGDECTVSRWHLIIAHPPCTYLCKVGSVHMYKTIDGCRVLNDERYTQMLKGREFFFECMSAQADFLAVENPLPMAIARLPQPDCFIQPSWYGVKYTKKTLYWLRNLPPLLPEILFPNPKSFVYASRGKYRSRTFPQVAEAIARQWGDWVLTHLPDGI